uniref:Odorant receptor 42 n=1 Tax=Apriona germarii TaxID=157307 RepID=A0A7G7WNE0_APRGE|nr:odorant receptor 42 [Apriona germarii]
MNLKIKELNSMEVDGDLGEYIKGLHTIIKYQQFLMRQAEDLNELLRAPVALLMIISVTMLCVVMYILTIHQGTTLDNARVMVVGCATVAEFFLVYGLPAQLLMDEAAATADMVYDETKWYHINMRPLRTYFLTMIARSQKGVYIKAANYHIVNNRTVVLILKTAYTFYTFLQRVAVVNNN